jgi:thiol-disulfide isomerase/thioredoxin
MSIQIARANDNNSVPDFTMASRFQRIRKSLLVGLVVGGVAAIMPGCNPPPPPGQQIGNSCIEISGTTPDGTQVKLSEYKGKVVLVSFWATWCPPCRELLPHERELVEGKYRNKPFAILGVALDEPEQLTAYLKSNPLPWISIADGRPGTIAKQWKVDSIPSAVLVDHTGVIRGRWIGGFDPADLWAAVEKAVRTAESN